MMTPGYDLDILVRARFHKLLHIHDGVAAANDWYARADPTISVGEDKDGQSLPQPVLENSALLHIGAALLRDVQTYVDRNPDVLKKPLDLAAVTGTEHFARAVRNCVWFTGSNPDFVIGIQDFYENTLVELGDKLIAVYRPGMGAWIVVVRDGIVIAAITAIVASKGRVLASPSIAAAKGMLPEVGSNYRPG